MRFLVCAIALGAVLACSQSSTSPHEPSVAGAWSLDSASVVSPGTMTLSQHGDAIVGSGSAMGVDVPIAVDIGGRFSPPTATSPPLVSLIFQFENGGGMTGQFTGTLTGPNHIQGSVIFYGIAQAPQTGSASYTRR
ncbi:MAG TPA: hypothetical protein VN607_00805 [Gemmatimonadaceae bacterium]|nr:hypothetical protein [Gemmatimonadaceae bacterium]